MPIIFRNLVYIAGFCRKKFGQSHVSDIFGRTATSRFGHRTDFGQKFSESGTTSLDAPDSVTQPGWKGMCPETNVRYIYRRSPPRYWWCCVGFASHTDAASLGGLFSLLIAPPRFLLRRRFSRERWLHSAIQPGPQSQFVHKCVAGDSCVIS